MRRWKRWTLVAVQLGGKSETAKLSRVLAAEWNSGAKREWFWTKRGAGQAAKFYSMIMPIGMKPVHENDLEASLADLAARS